MTDLPKLLNSREAAPCVGVAEKTLNNWRVLGLGPKFIRAGGRIVYDPSDIEEWKSAQRRSSTSELAA